MDLPNNVIVVNRDAVDDTPVRIVATPSRNAQVVVGIEAAARVAETGNERLERLTVSLAKACKLEE